MTLVMRLSPPDEGTEDNWEICGYHGGRYPIFVRNNDMSARDKQVGGEHYKLAIQPIDFIKKNNIPFIEGNVIKYVTRHREKNGRQDLEKAIHYLEMLLEDYDV